MQQKKPPPFPIRLEKKMPRILKACEILKLSKPVKFIKMAIDEKLDKLEV